MRVEVTGKKVLRFARHDYYVGDELEIPDIRQATALIAMRRVRALETPSPTQPSEPEPSKEPEQPEEPEEHIEPPQPEKTTKKNRRGYKRRDMTAEE